MEEAGVAGAGPVQWARALMLVTAVAALVSFAALAVWMATSDVVNFQGVEINVIFTIQKALLGSQLYTSPALPPFDVAQYTPLYYWVVIGICRAFGISGLDPAPVAMAARALSAMFSVGAIVFYYRILSACGVSSLARKVVAIAFASAATFPWLYLARPDALATLLSFGSLYLLLQADAGNRFKAGKYSLSVAFAILAVVAKQNTVVPLAMAVILPLSDRNWRALVIAAVMGAVSLMIVTLASPAIPFLRANIVDGVNNGIDFSWAWMHAYHFVIVWCLPLLAGAILAMSAWRRPWPRHLRLVSAAAISYFATAIAFSLKWGSAPNYYVEFVFFAAAIVCIGWERPARWADRRLIAVLAPLYIASFLTARFVNQFATYVPKAKIPTEQFHGWNPFTRFLLPRLTESPPAYVLALDLGLAAKLPRNSVIPSPEIAARAERRHVVDYSCFQSLVKSGRVRYLVTIAGWKPPDFAGADLTSFKLVGRLGEHWISENTITPPKQSSGPCR